MRTGEIDAICKIIKAHRDRSALATLRYIWREDKCKAKFGVFELGGVTKDIATDAAVLESGHEGRGEVVKHVVLSLRCDWSRKAESALYCLCLEWIEKFAPGRDWGGGVHTKDGNIHCHLAIRNADASGRCLKFKKADLYQMVSMSWTENAVPSKGTVGPGTQKFVDDYLDRGLAGRTNYEAVRSWAETRVRIGEFVAGRRDRAGRLTSIVLDGIRHRLKSIAKAVAEISKKQSEEVGLEFAAPRLILERPAPDRPTESEVAGDPVESFPDIGRIIAAAKKLPRLKKRRRPPRL
jgi:hypothetical protein